MDDYDIKWKNHPAETIDVIKRLRAYDAFTDVWLYCESDRKTLKANKTMLAACSAFFERIFVEIQTEAGNRSPFVVLRDVQARMLEFALEFIYTGEVMVPSDDLQTFVQLAEQLEIRGLQLGAGGGVGGGNVGAMEDEEGEFAEEAENGFEDFEFDAETIQINEHARLDQKLAPLQPTLKRKKPFPLAAVFKGIPPNFPPKKKKKKQLLINSVESSHSNATSSEESGQHESTPEPSEPRDEVKVKEEGDSAVDEIVDVNPDENSSMARLQVDVSGFDFNSHVPQNVPGVISTTEPMTRKTGFMWRGKRKGNPNTVFFCEICGHISSKSTHAEDHNRVHTGERPFRCRICDRSFTQKSHRNKHEITVHGYAHGPNISAAATS